MNPKQATNGWAEEKPTALLVLADGTVLEGHGLGATGSEVGEVCFNTAMTGYQEVLTDPSYAGQIITFTFPHVGNVGVNDEDIETVNMAAAHGARGAVLQADITEPSNYRASRHFDAWLKARGIVGLAGIDTRALTSLIREKGMPNGVIAHSPDGKFDIDALKKQAREWPGLDGMDLVPTRDHRAALFLGRNAVGMGQGLRPRRKSGIQRRLHRLRHQAQHSAPARCEQMQGDGRASNDFRRRHFADETGRRVSLERSRRSGGDRQIRRARDPETDRTRARRPSASVSAIR